jgi:hypothetical protein
MLALAIKHSKRSTTIQDQIFDLLSVCNYHKVKQQIKNLYQAAKHTMSEDEQNELLLDIYLDSLILDDYSTFWNYMEN